MNRKLVAVVTFGLCVSGCASLFGEPPAISAPEPTNNPPRRQAKKAAPVEDAFAGLPIERKRNVGDFFSHRFSGKFTDEPMLLTEEVVAAKDGLYVIDYELERGDDKTRLRVHLDPKADRVVRVAKVSGAEETEVDVVEFERLLEKTVFTADLNEGLVASERLTCMVGPDELDCETKNYQVFVGEQPATLSITNSEELGGRDVVGELTNADGIIIYRSELLEMRKGKKPSLANK
jgi:hypothetical protein